MCPLQRKFCSPVRLVFDWQDKFSGSTSSSTINVAQEAPAYICSAYIFSKMTQFAQQKHQWFECCSADKLEFPIIFLVFKPVNLSVCCTTFFRYIYRSITLLQENLWLRANACRSIFGFLSFTLYRKLTKKMGGNRLRISVLMTLRDLALCRHCVCF